MATDETTEEESKEPIVPEEENEEDAPEHSPEDDTETEEGDEPESDDSEPEDETIVSEPEKPKVDEKVEILPTVNGVKRVSGESDREFALRIENKTLRDRIGGTRTKEITSQKSPVIVQKEKKESEVLKKYKPEDIQALREVLPEIAGEMGYIKKDELDASNYEKVANEQIEAFVTDHPEYSIEKDPDSTLWNRLKDEYSNFYKPPTNPKDFKKIFERIHKDIFGIQAKGPLPKETAAKEKIKVASHASTSVPASQRYQSKQSVGGLRTDMLKGFSDEDIADIESSAE